ncbi:hypothetical protein A2160_06150 [Candidatus Beckwithbacteria bacterium RBG_13_42_9]|uniref:Uncharacterized protein n=1 Tax=Candidatus Beckwithbacteria bacterium RBG_13_42_9 TaxID=1797457 RepID=A0A1F5E5F5_9BACT|nr:MAG: hypothetical protein A2160_06150 [Candidatus Beckwithbacteria bacterium RBG_13_42_9]
MKKNSISTVTEIIEKSGNSFHSKVIQFFRDNEWSVLASPYFTDSSTEKPREIDLIVEKTFPVHGFIQGEVGTVNLRLFIECKYIVKEVVFWFDKIDHENAISRAMKDTGLDHPDKNITIRSNHFVETEAVAKLFASNADKRQENEIIYQAINQCLNAKIYYRNRRINFSEDSSDLRVLKTINYPVVICNNFTKLYKTDFNNTAPSNITEEFVLEINYAYLDSNRRSVNEYFLIDIVDFSMLDKFLKSIKDSDIDPVVTYESHRQTFSGIRKSGRGLY